MAASESAQVKSSDIQGLKHFKKIRKLLTSLHDVGCERDRARLATSSYDFHDFDIFIHSLSES